MVILLTSSRVSGYLQTASSLPAEVCWYLQWALGVGVLIGVAAFASLCWMLWQTHRYSDDAITNRILKAIENGKGFEAFDQGFICITSRADSKKWDHTIA